MKSLKSIKSIISIALLVCGILAGNAQEHGFRWGKWSEGHSVSGHLIDRVVDSYIDSAGNTYIFGQCGSAARLGEDGPYICPIDSMSGYSSGNNIKGVYLAKIDTAGNILWCKCARGGFNCFCLPWNMVVKDNKITIAFDYQWQKFLNNWFFFFDTMLIPPMRTVPHGISDICNTSFVTFDLDGNRLDAHEVQLNGTKSTVMVPLSWAFYQGRFVIDQDENIHIFTCSENFYENPSLRSYIIVDNDTNRKYQLGLKPNDEQYYSHAMYFKFDSTWNLVNKRFMMDSIASPYPPITWNKVQLFFEHVVVDGDELYVNGYLRNDDITGLEEIVADTDSFNATIFIDSAHYLTVSNLKDFYSMPFLIKLNTDGDVQWTQQIYTESRNHGAPNYTGLPTGGLAVDKDYVYANWCPGNNLIPNYFFLDAAHTIPIVHPAVNFNLTTYYDRATGEPIDFYLLDSTKKSTMGDLSLVKDIIVVSPEFQFERKTTICKINKHTKAVETEFPITYNGNNMTWHMSANRNGWIFRSDEGEGPHVYDSIFLGNYQEASVMTFFYDSTLDSRIKPCPQADSLWGDSIAHQTATLFWRSRYGQAGYELAYMPEGGSWDNATILETDSTTATIALPDDRCYQFRLRALCGGRREAYSPWCDPITLCPEHRTDVGIAPADSPRLALYPNPASGLVQILGLSGEAPDVEILDMTGRTAASFRHTTSIDISNLAQGSYLAQIHTAQGILTLKLVKD